MDPLTMRLIIFALALGEQLIVNFADGKSMAVDISTINDPEAFIKLVQESKSQNWPKLAFKSPIDEYRKDVKQP